MVTVTLCYHLACAWLPKFLMPRPMLSAGSYTNKGSDLSSTTSMIIYHHRGTGLGGVSGGNGHLALDTWCMCLWQSGWPHNLYHFPGHNNNGHSSRRMCLPTDKLEQLKSLLQSWGTRGPSPALIWSHSLVSSIITHVKW